MTNYSDFMVGSGMRAVYKAEAYVAKANDLVWVGSDQGTYTITLPSSPITSTAVAVYDAGNNAATNNITVARNGNTIDDLAEDFILDENFAQVHFIYDGTTWQLSINTAGAGLNEQQVSDLISSKTTSDGLITGSVSWISGLTFQVSDTEFVLGSTTYTTVADQITLTTADVSNPRIDVIAVNIDGSVDVVTGIAAADPAKPEVDSETQLEITFVLVDTSATTPSDITNTDVYLEDTEWTTADSGATIDPADTSDPNNGSVNILFNAAGDGDWLTFTDSSLHSPTEFSNLNFAIKNNVSNTSQRHRLRIALYNGSDRVSDWIDLRHDTYSFLGNNTSSYQNIIIPIADFNLGGDSFDVLRWEVEAGGANTLSFVADDVKFQVGVSSTPSGITQEDINISVLNKPETFSVACSDETSDLETGTATITFIMPYDFELTEIMANVNVAPTGANLIADINSGGSTIMTTNKVVIEAGETTTITAATQPTLTTTTLSRGDVITIDIDQIGSTVAGAGLKVYLIGHQR